MFDQDGSSGGDSGRGVRLIVRLDTIAEKANTQNQKAD
jgi:hypothetical protein